MKTEEKVIQNEVAVEEIKNKEAVKETKIENVVNETEKRIVKFSKPYTFEGSEYTEVDLTEIDNLTGEDLINADKIFSSTGQMAMVNEVNLGYLLIVASTATKKPISFFEKLPARDTIKVKNTVLTFLNN